MKLFRQLTTLFLNELEP